MSSSTPTVRAVPLIKIAMGTPFSEILNATALATVLQLADAGGKSWLSVEDNRTGRRQVADDAKLVRP